MKWSYLQSSECYLKFATSPLLVCQTFDELNFLQVLLFIVQLSIYYLVVSTSAVGFLPYSIIFVACIFFNS